MGIEPYSLECGSVHTIIKEEYMKKICFLMIVFLVVFSSTAFANSTISIDAYSNLKEYIGIPEENITDAGIIINFDNAAILGNDSTRNLEYDISFVNVTPKTITVFADVELAGYMRIYDDCPSGELLQEIFISTDGATNVEANEKLQAVRGNKNLCLAFDNSIRINFKGLEFAVEKRKLVDDIVFDVNTNSGINGATENPNGYFGNLQAANAWILWEDVDFGDTQRLLDLTVKYGISPDKTGTYVNVSIDSPDGEIIAQAPTEYQEGIGWEKPKLVTVPITQTVTGVHDVYASVDIGPYSTRVPAGNIYKLDFSTVSEKYNINYNMRSKVTEPQEFEGLLTFIKDSDTPEEIIFMLALYNSKNELVGVDFVRQEVLDVQNTIRASLLYSLINKSGEYTLKAYVWNSENNIPLLDSSKFLGVIKKA